MFKKSSYRGVKAFFEIIVRCDANSSYNGRVLDSRNYKSELFSDLIYIFEKDNQLFIPGKEPMSVEGFGMRYMDILEMLRALPFLCSVISYEIYGGGDFADCRVFSVITKSGNGTVVTAPIRMRYYGKETFFELDSEGFQIDGETSLEFTFKPKSVTKISFFSAHEIYRQILCGTFS